MAKKTTIPFEGKNYKVFTVNTDFGNYQVICVPRQYRNNTLAIEMIDVVDNMAEEPFATLTVNLCDPFSQTETKAFLDTNNCPWAERFVKKNKIAKDEYRTACSGFCRYPLYEFNLEALTA